MAVISEVLSEGDELSVSVATPPTAPAAEPAADAAAVSASSGDDDVDAEVDCAPLGAENRAARAASFKAEGGAAFGEGEYRLALTYFSQ